MNINPAFLSFELIVYLLFIACFINAWKRGAGVTAEFIGGLIFGILLEYINANYLSDYHYGQFLVMLKNVPLCIGAGWAVIIYSSMALSDRSGIITWTRPFADALMALNIDLSMDIIAIRIGDGMWVWGWPDQSIRWTAEWFGVPFGNFFGWFFVVLLYSGMIRMGRYAADKYRLKNLLKIFIPFVSVIISELILAGLILFFTFLWDNGFPAALIILFPVITGIFVLSWKGRFDITDKPEGLIINVIPLFFHIFFLASLFVFKITAWSPYLLLISVLMLLAGFIVQLKILKII